MKKSKLSKLLILSLSALCVFSSCNNKNSSSEPSSSVSEPSSSSSSSSTEAQPAKWGTEEAPLSAAELYEKMKNMGDDEWTTEKGYLTGVVKTITYKENFKNYEIELVTDGSYVVAIYGAVIGNGVSVPAAGDTVVGYGFFQRYHSSSTGAIKYELAYSEEKGNPEIIKVEKGDAPVIEYEGSIDEPLTIAELSDKIATLKKDEKSTKVAYVTGVVSSITVKTSNYEINIVDDDKKTIKLYGAVLGEGQSVPTVGDTVVAYGYYCNYSGTYELTSHNNVTPSIVKSNHNTYAITLINEGNATVTGLPETGESGSSISFSAVAPEGYKIASVTVNDKKILASSGTYSFVLENGASIKIETVDQSVPLPALLEDESVDFTTKAHSHNSYKDTWEYGEWTISSGSNYSAAWTYLKFGGKSEYLSNSDIPTPSASTTNAIAAPVHQVILTTNAGTIPNGKMSASIKLIVASDSSFSTIIDEVDGGEITSKKEKEYIFSPTEGETWEEGLYYKIEFEVTNTSDNNGIVWVNSIDLYTLI